MTVTFARSGKDGEPQLVFGHMLDVKAGWLDEHTFVFVYETLDPYAFQSPVYPSGLVDSAIEIVQCNKSYLDCSPLERRLQPARIFAVKAFPEGGWWKWKWN